MICPECDTCSEHCNTCEDGSQSKKFSQFFECTEVCNNNGQQARVGPRLGGGGRSGAV